MGEERSEENWNFRTFLKQLPIDGDELDSIVHQITAEVSSQIDCTKCANCCKQINPVLGKDDVSNFAKGLKISTSELEQNYLILHEDKPSQHEFKEKPCPFLKEDRCSNYDHRPTDCRSYPHLYKDRFVSRLMNVIGNYSICPIVFNVYERLKADLWQDVGIDEY